VQGAGGRGTRRETRRETRWGERVVTPEAVAVDLDVAGLGSRMIAALIDGAIQVGLTILVALLISGLEVQGAALAILWIVTSFIVFWGYFFIFEGLWQGRTPGKRTQRLRVVRTDGHPMSGAQMFVRNLLRIVDFLPAYYAAGAVSIVLTRRSQRIGDLAAGTLVIRERKPTVPVALPVPLPPAPGSGPHLDTSGLTEAQYQLVRSFLGRRATLDPAARAEVAMQIARAIQPAIGATPPGMTIERLLEAVAAAHGARSSPLPEPPGSGGDRPASPF
jgi:uncharacterized RDD family membrane protein YckC